MHMHIKNNQLSKLATTNKSVIMSVADLSKNQLKELSKYLKEFAPSEEDDDNSEQYWFLLADHLRKTKRKQFDYTNDVCKLY